MNQAALEKAFWTVVLVAVAMAVNRYVIRPMWPATTTG